MRWKVAAGDAGDGQGCFAVGGVCGVDGEPEFGPVQGQHGRHVGGVQWPVLVGEADPAVQLRGSGRVAVRIRACRSG